MLLQIFHPVGFRLLLVPVFGVIIGPFPVFRLDGPVFISGGRNTIVKSKIDTEHEADNEYFTQGYFKAV